ncbi:MAG: tRNA (adenosine(37)-N6)-threonylcarbamoyltransferase complex ATPase subunit type 1 TsaE [bacterium]
MRKISKNTKDTEQIALDFIKDFVEKHDFSKDEAFVVGLYGDLGAGKTTFTQALGKHLKINRKVNSPTFVIMKRYDLKKSSFDNLIHIDAYRLKNESELLHLGWQEMISNPKNLIFIEWPENIIKAMPKKHHQIHIAHTKEGHREFKIKKS